MKPVKWVGYVEEVVDDGWIARVFIGKGEYTADFLLSRWPTDKLHLLKPGTRFSLPSRRDRLSRPVYVIDRPVVTRSQIKRARIRARELRRRITIE